MVKMIDVEVKTVGLFFVWLLVWLTWLPALACWGIACFFSGLFTYQYRLYQWCRKEMESGV